MSETTVNNLIDTPINNLALLIGILALLIVIGIGVLIAKFGPLLYKLFKDQSDTNKRLTDIAEQNTAQVTSNAKLIADNTTEMQRQTQAIHTQTEVIQVQSLDIRNYQALVSDNLSAYDNTLNNHTITIQALVTRVDLLATEIASALSGMVPCERVEKLIEELKTDVVKAIQESAIKRKTGELPAANGEGS